MTDLQKYQLAELLGSRNGSSSYYKPSAWLFRYEKGTYNLSITHRCVVEKISVRLSIKLWKLI